VTGVVQVLSTSELRHTSHTARHLYRPNNHHPPHQSLHFVVVIVCS